LSKNIASTNHELATLIKNYGPFSALLLSYNLTFDKSLRVNILKDLLQPYVTEKRKEKEGMADEFRYRLGFFNIYGEYQLQNLLFSWNNNSLEEEYLVRIYQALEKQMPDPDILKPVLLQTKARSCIKEIDEDLNRIFVDKNGAFDGLDLDLIRPVLYHSSLIEEIKELGAKYEVAIPKRFKKAELVECVLGYFPALEEEKIAELRANLLTLPPTLITRFAKDNNILVSQDLKKEEAIEYILKNSAVLAAAYRRPTSRKDYYFTEEQKQKYGLVEVRAYEEDSLTTNISAKTKDVYREDSPKKSPKEIKKSSLATFLYISLTVLATISFGLVIYFVFFAGLRN
jgi:hypothetical protein